MQSEEVLEIVFKASEEKYKNEDASLEIRRQSFENALCALEERQGRLVDSFVAGITPSDVYEQKMLVLKNERVVLQSQLAQLGRGDKQGFIAFEQVKEVFLTANSIANSFLGVDDEQKRKYVEILLSNATIGNQKVQHFQFKTPYQPIANMPENRDFLTVLACVDQVRTILSLETQLC